MPITAESLRATADTWWSDPEAVSATSAFGGIGLIRWSHSPGVSPAMDVPFHTLRYRLKKYRSRRILRGGLADYSGPRGSVAIITMGTQETWEYLDDVDCVEFYFTQEHIESVADREGLARLALREHTSVDDPLLNALTSELAGLALAGERETLYVETLINAVLLRIARAHSERQTGASGSRDGLAPWIRRRTTENLHFNLANDVSLSQLAAEADMPPFEFARAFQRSTGYSPFGYQRRLRMERAQALLISTNSPVVEISRLIGYQNATVFCEIFKNSFGKDPEEWRKGIASRLE